MSVTEERRLCARFRIKQDPEVEPRPFYIYKFSIEDADGHYLEDINWRKVIDKVLNMVIEEQEPESSLYIQDIPYLYTQFQITKNTACAPTARSSTGEQHKLRWEVESDDGSIVHLNLCLKGSPIIDLASCDGAYYEVKRALLSMSLAEIEVNYNFISEGDDPGAEFFELKDGSEKQITKLGKWVSHCWGLDISVSLSSESPNVFEFICIESEQYFYGAHNLVDLLEVLFKCDVRTPLKPSQMKTFVDFLIDIEVKFKPEWNIQRRECDYDVTLTHKVYKIEGVREKPMSEDFFLSRVTGQDKLVESISAEELLMQQFPYMKLHYKNLPCLVVAGGDHLPMEFCWIKSYQFMKINIAKELRVDEGVTWPTPAGRHRILAENCNRFYRQSSYLREFGYTFELSSRRQ